MATTRLTFISRIVITVLSGALLLGAAPTTPVAVAKNHKVKPWKADKTFSGDGRKNH